MEKQPLSTTFFDNGMKSLIERYPGLGSRYVEGVKENLKKVPGAKAYGRNQIMRVVMNKVPLNHQSMAIKKAFMMMYEELYPVTEAELV